MSSMPELCDITNALVDLQGEFFELGIQLKLQHKQLKAIENDHKGNQSRCLIETIVLWQQNDTTGECSWSTLAEAVKNVGGHEKLVSELKKRDMTDSNPKALHYPPEPTERANEGCASVSDSTRQRYDSKTRPSESEDESGYSSKNDSVQSGDSSGSEIECFEQAPGCGCTDKKPCSVYALCAGGCPNPTRKRVPVLIKKSNADAISSQNEIPFEVKYDFEDYEKRTKEMQKSYGSFAYETLRQFKISNLNIRELTIYIQGAYPVMKPRMEELSKAIHFEDFFMIIMDQGCSWFDYEIIKDLILLFCTSAKSCLDEYEVCFKMYAEQRLPNGMKHIKIGSGARKGGKHLVIKIDREWEKVTFSDLDKVRGAFASILDVRRSDLYLADIREGCIMMTFMITEELAGRLFPSRTCLTSTQVQSLKDEGVLSVKCGSFNWQAAASNSNSHTPSPETRFDCNKQNPDSTKQIVDHLQYKLPQERKKLPILPKTDGNAKYDIHDQNAEDNLYADHSKQINKFSEIVYALTPLADKYFELGMQLELDYEQLKAIENDNHGNQSLCLHDTIYLWQQNNTTGECSWSTLAEAVNRVGGHDKLVSELKKRDMAGSKPQAPHHPPETERANEGYISVSDSALQRCDSRPSESEDESGCSSKSDSVQSGDSSESEAEFFELAPGCGCTGEKPCSLYTLCAGGCPNPTKMRVSVLRKKSKAGAMSSQNGIPFEEECDFENYEERTKAIHKSFGIFLCETSHYFETSKVDIQKLTLYVQGTYPVMKPRMEELSKVTHFADFFRIIVDQACSWFDYGIIKDLILLFCTSAKSCLDQYETCFKKYAEQRLPKGMKHIEIGGGAKKGGKQLVIKIDREWEEVTFSDPNKLQGTFASILGPGVRRSDLYLADIREGCSCIMMTFMITEELAGRLFPSKTCLTSSQVKSLKDEGVLSVKCGNLSWRAAASNNERDRARPETRVPQNSLSWRLKIFDIRIMMAVMLLLALIFGGLLLYMRATQVNSDHAQAVIPAVQLTDIKLITDDLEDVELKITYTQYAKIIMEYEFYDPYYFLESSKTAHYIVGYSAIWTLDDVAITDDLLNIFKTDDVECPTFFHGIMTWIYDNVTRPNTTIDSIPISPDMTLISEQLTVSMPFSVEISFLPVNPCSVKFPLHSYTIAAGDAVTHVVDAEMVIPDPDRRVRLKLVLSGVALDNSYNLTVTACNAITSNNITGCPTVTGPGTAAGLSSTDTAIVGGLLGPTFAIAVIIAVIIIVIIIVKSKKIQNKQYVGVVGKYIDTEVSGGHPPRGCTEITNTSSLTHAVNWESDAETESKLQSEIEYNPESETAPLITKGCSFDDKKGTIIINTRKLFNALKIDPSKIKQLKMKDNNYY